MSGYGNTDFESSEEMTTAMAQAIVYQAIRRAGISQAELARRLGVNRSRVTQILERNMTMRTFARAVAACGFELRFALAKASATAKGGE